MSSGVSTADWQLRLPVSTMVWVRADLMGCTRLNWLHCWGQVDLFSEKTSRGWEEREREGERGMWGEMRIPWRKKCIKRISRLAWIYSVLPQWTPVDKLPCFTAADGTKRASYTRLNLYSINRRRKTRGQAILMLIGIITGVLSAVGEAVSLFINWMGSKPPARRLSAESNSKLTVYSHKATCLAHAACKS